MNPQNIIHHRSMHVELLGNNGSQQIIMHSIVHFTFNARSNIAIGRKEAYIKRISNPNINKVISYARSTVTLS
jgi:hypothetical protein